MRLAPLPAEQWDDEVVGSLRGFLPRARQNPDGAGNAMSTMVHHPALTKAFMPLNLHLLFSSTLDPRLRELAILRVAHRRESPYEWAHHTSMAKMLGVTDDEIESVRRGEAADDFERLVLAAVDELDDNNGLSDETWTALGERLDERQRMDLIFTVGTYNMLAMAFNTFGVQLDKQER
ncbi:carboxymuconolactone decarboxylase family protein [Mycolicibacterium arseniciresistens]|uniref:Carboxymuconolactone decarboxylase family protein n=1 Tax=Mycolicibacterium arseniciresistens TaxID=3062257 RepID=A0ABT8UQU9_9MYCO|nr:carboxymuconolactone decarboxylase family protein [Mycolicibacterium arseniciresistens]MDO3638773.1 carboxymuconolactone decarboxylase family protein [Mycolicibacterium arseniciresistens]